VTIEQLSDRCAYWQKRLRLQDWDIKLEYARDRDMPNCWGQVIRWNVDNRTAVIQFVEPGSFSMVDYPYGHFDLEDTLIHELLHIYTEGILGRGNGMNPDRDSAQNTFAEQLCDAIAAALVALDRERFSPVTTITKVEPDALVDMLGAPIMQANGIG
jgi:hypothetical protein